jgi:NAD(P)-dependent dehydrogenase (short-subunit alcohol dehydrogenase family)
MELAGKGALITAGKRIGGAVAVEIARRGADVAIVYHRSREEAEGTAEAVRALGRACALLQADLRDADACGRVVDQAAAALGRLDVLVNAAAVYTPRRFADLTLEDWNAVMDVDLRAAWLCARAVIPHMRRHGGGRIVNFSDWIARSGRPRYREFLPYYVAKTAVIALTESLALELAGDQILVNAVAPGAILPPPGAADSWVANVERITPVGRWGGAEELAKTVLALIETDYITGEVVRVDGGRHLR